MDIVSPLPTGVAGEPYEVALAHVGRSKSCAWSLSAGALPGGLSFDISGHLSGTPYTPGNARFTVQAKEIGVSNPQTATATFTMVIEPAALEVTTTSLPSAQVGVAYSETLEAYGGTPPYRWSASGLPAGLTCSGSGEITGTPTAAGTDSVVLTVTDSA